MKTLHKKVNASALLRRVKKFLVSMQISTGTSAVLEGQSGAALSLNFNKELPWRGEAGRRRGREGAREEEEEGEMCRVSIKALSRHQKRLLQQEY